MTAALMQMRPGAWVPSSGRYAPDVAGMQRDIATIVGDGTPRVVGTPEGAAGRERIRSIFPSEVEFSEHVVKFTKGRGIIEPVEVVNLVGRIKGTAGDEAGVLAVVSHGDSVRVSPGAGDAGAGVAAVAAIARSLVNEPPRHDVIVLITDGEEAGLLGSRTFMETHPWAEELKGVVNLDARGAAGPAFVYEFGSNTAELVAAMKRHLHAPRTTSLAAYVSELMPNGTDFMVFRRGGLTGYNVAFLGDHPAYHTEHDRPERLDPGTLAHYAHTGLALIRALDEIGKWVPDRSGVTHLPPDHPMSPPLSADGRPVVPPPQPRAAWMDVLGLWILAWPESWGVPIACAVAGALLMVLVLLLRNPERQDTGARRMISRTIRGVGSTVGALTVAFLVAGTVGFAMQWASRTAGLTTHNAPWRMQMLNCLLWLAAGVLVAGVGVFKVRTSGVTARTVWAGVWLAWSALACVAGWLLPAAGPLLVIPPALAVVGAGVGGMICRTTGGDATRAMVIWGGLAGLAGAVFTWMPLEPTLLDALGMTVASATGARAVLVLAPLAPLLTLAVKGAGAASTPLPRCTG